MMTGPYIGTITFLVIWWAAIALTVRSIRNSRDAAVARILAQYQIDISATREMQALRAAVEKRDSDEIAELRRELADLKATSTGTPSTNAGTPVHAPADPPAPTGPPPGWYDDPAKVSDLRWWDGTRWTDHVSGRTVDSPRP